MKSEESQFNGSRVLITGGLGFVGSTLARRLADLGASVLLVDNLAPDGGGCLFNVSDVRDRVDVEIADVRDVGKMRHFVRGQDYMFNLAGKTSHMDSMIYPLADLEVNCLAQVGILECCREVNPAIRIVFASTRQLYGRPEYLPVDERHLVHPVDVNGINKLAGEWYHRLYSEVYGIRSTVLRLTNTYGPRMRIKDARQMFMGIWIRRVLEAAPFEVWGGAQRRDFTYVDDCVDALLLSATSELAIGRVYNLGGTDVVSLSEAAAVLIEAAGAGVFDVRDFPATRKAIDVGDYYSDFSLIHNELGWQPKMTLLAGLERTVSYFRSNLTAYV